MDQNLGEKLMMVSRFAIASNKFNALVIAAMITLGCIGCGGGDDFKPTLGLVKGTVTINDAAAPDLTVTFEPQRTAGSKDAKVGSASAATTDAQGKYELTYGGDGSSKGAVVGSHAVRIESASGGGPAGGENAVVAVFIPEQYNSQTTLKAEVAAGENPPIDFKLEIPKQ